MVRVAVAGGTGGIGLTVVEAIVANKKHDVFVLSRKLESGITPTISGATVLGIDYSSPDAIGTVLRENRVDTVISCVTLQTEEASKAQLNLIEGAARSTTVLRFAPSEFGIDYLEAARLNYAFPSMDFKNAAIEKLRATPSLSYTRFVNGTFMDYLGPPRVKSHLKLISLIIDIENSKAAIPGNGNVPVVFTHSTDLARFVEAALSLNVWPEVSLIKGDKVTLEELVSIAEKVKGSKFDVKHDTADDLRAGKNTELPANIPRYQFLPKPMIDNISQMVGLAMESGWMNLKGDFLNDVIPEVKPMSVEEFFKECLSKK